MAFQLSPGVLVTERDLTNIIPAVATSTGAFAGSFVWGPVLDPVTISSENQLVARFGKPATGNAESFFTAANFLSYSNNLIVARTDTANARNAVATPSGTLVNPSISSAGYNYGPSDAVVVGAPNIDGGTQATASVTLIDGTLYSMEVDSGGVDYSENAVVSFNTPTGGVAAVGTLTVVGGQITGINIVESGKGYTETGPNAPVATVTDIPGGIGDGFAQGTFVLRDGVVSAISITEPGSGYTSPASININSTTGSGFSGSATVLVGGVKINNEADYTNTYVGGAGVVGTWAAKYPGALGNSLTISIADSASFSAWEYSGNFDTAPGTSSYVSNMGGSNDELHIVIIDADGKWSGVTGTVLEKFAYVSKASGAKKVDGATNYYRDVINTDSKYVWWMDHPAGKAGPANQGGWGNEGSTSFSTLVADETVTLSGGVDDLASDAGDLQTAFGLFANSELYDVSLIATGKVEPAVAKWVVDNVAEVRRDCVVFVSPTTSSGNMITGVDAVADTITFRTNSSFNVNSSYAVLDSGFKYQYDRYNDVYRWVPLNGDVAGLCARTDYTNDAWWSPGGLNRGQIKNVVKLSLNPSKTDRDDLYKAGINPVVSFPGQGTVLFGDKTLLTKPSAFDRINVRRLFIVLEKAIATAAQYQLFEFNDSFTRAQFRSMVEPFLRDVQGRRGINDFRVICDENNNTGEVIDRNEFVADIYIKPARSINFITLNFIAARSSISFDEIGA